MGIRDTSYYGWKNLRNEPGYPGQSRFTYTDLAVDSTGNMYICGYYFPTRLPSEIHDRTIAFVQRSRDGGNVWEYIDRLEYTESASVANGLAISPLDESKIYWVGVKELPNQTSSFIVRSSSDYGDTWATVNVGLSADRTQISLTAVDMSSSGKLFACGVSGTTCVVLTGSSEGHWDLTDLSSSTNNNAYFYDIAVGGGRVVTVGYEINGVGSMAYLIRSSSDGGVSWSVPAVERFAITGGGATAHRVIFSGSKFIVAGFDDSLPGYAWRIRSSSNGGAWGSLSSGTIGGTAHGISYNPQGDLIITGMTGSTAFAVIVLSGTNVLQTIDGCISGTHGSVVVNSRNEVNIIGDGTYIGAYYRKGALTANSATLGPMSLATSFEYVQSEVSGAINRLRKLHNISEFPHSAGAFQMRNLIIGTTDSGKIGKDSDSIVQLKHYGSVVKVLWPKQDLGTDEYVKGYGDFSVGQRPGKLTTDFIPGDFLDVSTYDHLSLYCYAKSNGTGSLDDIVIRIERRPLRDLPFAPDQTISYAESGSFTTEATLKELIFKKPINYGDPSMKEIGFPIDVPLENTREVRVSCRQKVGQANDENKNFVIWGRFIRSEEET